MSVINIQADARALPLPDSSVDLIVTSPPYFALRSYQDGGQHYDEQIGSETTPVQYLDAMVECIREWMRVLKPCGSLFINMGDSYSAYNNRGYGGKLSSRADRGRGSQAKELQWHVPAKSLNGTPWRLALRCIDELGLILRAEVIWCLSGGARLYARLPTGDRPIALGDLTRHYRPEDIQLWNGERWTQVLGWSQTADIDDALEIELRTGERIGCTSGHKWPTQRGLFRTDELHVGDRIQTTRLPEPEDPRDPDGLPYDDIGWLVGLYIAEGSRSETTIQIAGHLNEDIRHQRLARIAAAYDGTFNVYRTGENCVTANLHGSVLAGIINRYVSAGTSKTKRLTVHAWQRTNSFLAAVMEGYLDGDGHYDAKNDRYRLTFTTNNDWAADLRCIAARLGVGIRLRRGSTTFNGKAYPIWRGEWRWYRSNHWNVRPNGEVVAIRSGRGREFYDIGVADKPNIFALASGILTHNSKPNGLPESVTDRVRRSHEQVFHFTLQPRYYSAVDEVREPHVRPRNAAQMASNAQSPKSAMRHGSAVGVMRGGHKPRDGGDFTGSNPLGKLPGSVWTIPSAPLKLPEWLGVDHFASYPCDLIRPIILGWSPPGICVECGEGRRPVAFSVKVTSRPGYNVRDQRMPGRHASGNQGREGRAGDYHRTITDYVCACPTPTAPTRPAIVLDPFGGTGTTSLVASTHGRIGISVDLSFDYARIAAWRTSDPGERARALKVEKPPEQLPGQAELFEDLA